jgi:polysaccharide biosynthesis transport protein
MMQPEGPAYAIDPRDQLRLIDFIDVIKRRWLLIVLITLAFVAAAAAYVTFLPKVYRATASLLVAQPKVSDTVLPTTPMGTYRALLQDPSLATVALTNLGLDKAPHYFNAAAFAATNIQIEEVPATSMLRVHVEMTDPALAAAVANGLATAAVELNQRLSEQEAVYASDRMREQVVQARTRLDHSEKQLLDFKSAAQVDVLEQDTNSLLRQRADLLPLSLEIAGERARAERAEYELRQQNRVLEVPRTTGTLGGLMESAVERANRDLAADNKLANNAQTSANRSPESPTKVARQSVAADLPPRAPFAEATPLRAPHSDSQFLNPVWEALMYQAATSRARLAALEIQQSLLTKRKVGAAELPQLRRLYGQQIEEARRELELAIARRTYEDISARYDQARVQIASRTSQLQVVGQAVPPLRPSSPRRALIVTGAFTIALIVSLFVAFLLEYMSVSRTAGARIPTRAD